MGNFLISMGFEWACDDPWAESFPGVVMQGERFWERRLVDAHGRVVDDWDVRLAHVITAR